ncbi:glycosyltransferase family 4 protein [Salinisphaera sp. T31B1]|uniref:glycosyltransferase family 4 protein n=1 Tax=Salinisphaera sp. T31B1 TaxID=727963 RepID=UPI0033407AE5
MQDSPGPERPAPRGRSKVVFVANSDWYLYNFRSDLIAMAEKTGWEVELICPDGEYVPKLRARGWPVTVIPLDSRGANPLREADAWRRLLRALRAAEPDVLHLFTLKCVLYGCIAAPLIAKTRVIGAITGLGHLFTTRNWRTRLLKPPVLVAMKLALWASRAHLIFQNEHDREEFVGRGLLARERTTVIRGSGVDCEQFKPPEEPAAPKGHARKLLFCGRLLREKGIHEYLSMAERLREMGCEFDSYLAGAPYPGNPSSLSQAEVDELIRSGGHHYLGHHADMAGLLATTDIVVLPTYREGTPKALLEAAASGCVIVTTDIPGCQGIVEPGENGYLVPVHQVAPLVEAVARLLDAPQEPLSAMKSRSRDIAENRFSVKKVNEATLALY